MEKAVFTNKIFFYALFLFISATLLYNIYTLIFHFEFILFLPILIQIILIVLILIRYQYIKLLLQIWSGVFIVTASILSLLGKWLMDLSDGFMYFNYVDYLPKLTLLLVGIIIYIGSTKKIITEQI